MSLRRILSIMKNPLFFLLGLFCVSMSSGQLVINEILADPAAGASGDANGDGDADTGDDEFLELVNISGGALEIGGWQIRDLVRVRHIFPEGVVLQPGQAAVIFGGGDPSGDFGGAVVSISSQGSLGLNNTGDTIEVDDGDGVTVTSATYGAIGGSDQSLTRDPDLTGETLVRHSEVGDGSLLFSPGTQVDGSSFVGDVVMVSIDPASFSEGDGAAAAVGTVSRGGDLTEELEVSLVSDDESELMVPETVTILVGQASQNFDVTAVDDEEQDGTQEVTISASAEGLFSSEVIVEVMDDEDPLPTIVLTSDVLELSENGGSATITVEISEADPEGVILLVEVDDDTELLVPGSVTIAPDATSATFTVSGIDDDEIDGLQTVVVTVSDSEGLVVSETIEIGVADDEEPVVPSITINELRINAPTEVPGNGEYFELFSDVPNASLDGLSLIVLGDLPAEGSGAIEEVISLDGLVMNGNFFVMAGNGTTLVEAPDEMRALNFENNDNLTFLLVSGFTGAEGDDLDTDDDGSLDASPWEVILDGLALVIDGDTPPSISEFEYATNLGFPVLGPAGDFVPGHVFRSPDGSGVFNIGGFDPDSDDGADTPGMENVFIFNPGPLDLAQFLSITVGRSANRVIFEYDGISDADGLTIEKSQDLGQDDPWEEVEMIERIGLGGELVEFEVRDTEILGEDKFFFRLVEVTEP